MNRHPLAKEGVIPSLGEVILWVALALAEINYPHLRLESVIK